MTTPTTATDKRREAIIKSLTDLGKLTPELEKQLNEAETMTLLEDIYLPYRPKRKTTTVVGVVTNNLRVGHSSACVNECPEGCW